VTSHKIDFQINDQNGEHFVLDLLSKGLDRSYLSAHGVQKPKKNIRVLHITGEGGSGKTTLLYKLYLDFIKKPNDLYRFIFVDLSVVNSTDHLSDFEAHASHKMLYLNTVREEILQPSNLGKKIILMIEGLDVPVRAINDQGEAISRDHKRKMINDFYHLMNDSDLIVQNIDLKMSIDGTVGIPGFVSGKVKVNPILKFLFGKNQVYLSSNNQAGMLNHPGYSLSSKSMREFFIQSFNALGLKINQFDLALYFEARKSVLEVSESAAVYTQKIKEDQTYERQSKMFQNVESYAGFNGSYQYDERLKINVNTGVNTNFNGGFRIEASVTAPLSN
jgi:hypothetical protein